MLKIHPDNFSAKGVIKNIGFIQGGAEPGSGKIIYHLEIGRRTPGKNDSDPKLR